MFLSSRPGHIHLPCFIINIQVPTIVGNHSSHQSKQFQSAPHAEARGDKGLERKAKGRLCFNPLPSPKRGETHSRAARSRAGWCFNPLPSPKRGETARLRSLRHPTFCFNPLPSPKRGETQQVAGLVVREKVSIRSPHRSEGRLLPRAESRSRAYRFNPLPSPKRGETGSTSWFRCRASTFQSAPLTEARGDRGPPLDSPDT